MTMNSGLVMRGSSWPRARHRSSEPGSGKRAARADPCRARPWPPARSDRTRDRGEPGSIGAEEHAPARSVRRGAHHWAVRRPGTEREDRAPEPEGTRDRPVPGRRHDASADDTGVGRQTVASFPGRALCRPLVASLEAPARTVSPGPLRAQAKSRDRSHARQIRARARQIPLPSGIDSPLVELDAGPSDERTVIELVGRPVRRKRGLLGFVAGRFWDASFLRPECLARIEEAKPLAAMSPR